MTNTPLYRAKKIDGDGYVVGYLCQDLELDYTIDFYDNEMFFESYKIDPSTLSISFPDMVDSEGNRIFASLQDDGRGGSICYSDMYKTKCYMKHLGSCLSILDLKENHWLRSNIVSSDLKVIGIKE